jgi:twinkle protein
MLSREAIEWLEDRGLDVERCERYGLSSTRPRGVASGEWICAPFIRDGKTVNNKYRQIDAEPGAKPFLKDKGKPPLFWNESAITDTTLDSEPLIITEGIEDALAMISAGFIRTVSVPDGAPQERPGEDSKRFQFIEEITPALNRVARVIIASDDDQPGHMLAEYLSEILGPARCKRVDYGEGCKDANDVLVRHGAKALRARVEAARWVNVPGVRRLLSDYPASAEKDPLIVRADLSHDFNKHVGFVMGFTSAWTGIPGHGKTQLLKQVSWRLAETAGIKAAVGSFEESFPRDYRRHYRQYHIGRPRYSNRGDWTPGEMASADNWLDENIIALDPHGYDGQDEIDVTLDWFVEAARTAIVRHGVQFLVCDPWGEIEQGRANGETEHEYTGRALTRINRLARMFGVHIALVAHPRKLEAFKGKIKEPGPYDISGSSFWFNKVSLGGTVHNDPIEDDDGGPADASRTKVTIWKSKFKDIQGPTGSLHLMFNKFKGRYLPPERVQGPRTNARATPSPEDAED